MEHGETEKGPRRVLMLPCESYSVQLSLHLGDIRHRLALDYAFCWACLAIDY
jgi:hypothetical protein